MSRFLAALATLLAIGCGSSSDASPSSTGGTDDPCPSGGQWVDDAAEAGFCAPALPADACPAGTMPRIGIEECQPVGWQECPPGFVADPSGWGCADVLPPEPCPSGLRDALGSETCQPIGDCAAEFPPAGATLFVDASFDAGDLDATHFASVELALAAAADGDLIAVASGVYPGRLVAPDGAVAIVGECPDRTTLAADGDEAILVGSGSALEVRGVTITGGLPGVRVSGGSLVLEDVELADNTREALRASGGEVELLRTVVRGTEPPAVGEQALGILVYGGARVSIVDSAIVDNVEGGVGCIDAGTEVTLEGSVVRATRPQPGNGGIGAKAFDGSHLSIRRSALVANQQVSVLVGGPGTVAEIEGTVVRDTILDETLPAGAMAWGVVSRLTAALSMTDSSVVRTPGIALETDNDATLTAARVVVRDGQATGWLPVAIGALAGEGATLDAIESAFVGNVGMSVVADSLGVTRLRDSLVHATLPTGDNDQEQPGRGGTGVATLNGGRAELERCAITDGAEAAVHAYGEGSFVSAVESVISGATATTLSLYGYGLLVKDGARGELRASAIRGAASAAIVFSAAGGIVTGSYLYDSAIGVQAQQGASLREGDPDPLAGPLDVLFSSDTRIWNVGARVGAGELALPDPLETPSSP